MILTIRAHRRYAVRRSIRLRSPVDGRHCGGLLVELSSEGCRVSGLGDSDFVADDKIIVEHDGMELPGRIRWIEAGVAGVRLDTLMMARELSAYLTHLRGADLPSSAVVGPDESVALRRAG